LTVTDVDIERDGFVATLVMRGSGDHNAVGGTLLRDLLEAVEELERDDGVRVVVTAAEGPIWCASADFEDLDRHLGPFERPQPFACYLQGAA
jgi:enoyl-CoA hydratase/carnithine racemase